MAKTKTSNGANLGFEATLWAAADKLRNNMDAAEYKHVVLGLIFLKYISDSFEEVHNTLRSDPTSDPEDRDEYVAKNVFWVPKAARWDYIQGNAKQPTIGKIIDDAMDVAEMVGDIDAFLEGVVYMSIPKDEDCWLPNLEFAADEREHMRKDFVKNICDLFQLTYDEQNLRYQSGNRPKVVNQTANFALKYLEEALLLKRVRRSTYVITKRGKELLSRHPSTITLGMLKQYPEFVAYFTRRNPGRRGVPG